MEQPPADQKQRRVDQLGRAKAGSQLQTQIYVSKRTAELSQAVAAALDLNPAVIEWKAPREQDRFREPVDGSFLAALGLEEASHELRKFWPKRGPSWDALALVRRDDGENGYILAEGKSYPEEMTGRGCAAGEESLRLINRSLEKAKEFFGVPQSISWTGDYYQYANRLAHVYFIREVIGRPAWLVNLCFTGDSTTRAVLEPTWRKELQRIKRDLGFERDIPFTADVFLAGRTREELLVPK